MSCGSARLQRFNDYSLLPPASSLISRLNKVRNLGVDFDSESEMTVRAHIAKTAQTCFLHLRRLRQIRRLLGRNVACTLVSAFVLSRVDYWNAVLSGLPQYHVAAATYLHSASSVSRLARPRRTTRHCLLISSLLSATPISRARASRPVTSNWPSFRLV